MTGNQPGEVRKCTALTPQESDKLFFPGPGGKVNKARAYCSDCPLIKQCLINAIDSNLDGFFAGTTKDDRHEMAKFRASIVQDLSDFVDSLLPKKPEPGRRVKKVAPLPAIHEWLDQVEPTEEELVLVERLALA